MPKGPVPPQVAEFLARPNAGVMATLRPDGQPVTVATWYLYEDGRVLVNLDATRKRLDHLRTDPRVSLTAFPLDDFGTHVSVQGRVVELTQDPDLSVIDRIAEHYTGKPYALREATRYSAWIEIDSWHGWGAFRNAS